LLSAGGSEELTSNQQRRKPEININVEKGGLNRNCQKILPLMNLKKCCKAGMPMNVHCPPEEHNAQIIFFFCMRAILDRGQGGARTEVEEEEKNETTKLLSNLILHEKEICAHMQEVHTGNQKCGGCPIPVDIAIPVAGLQPTLEIFLEVNKDEGFKLGNRAFNIILTYWKESLEKLDHKCQKGRYEVVGKIFCFKPSQYTTSRPKMPGKLNLCLKTQQQTQRQNRLPENTGNNKSDTT
jgi:hypothetical protein